MVVLRLSLHQRGNSCHDREFRLFSMSFIADFMSDYLLLRRTFSGRTFQRLVPPGKIDDTPIVPPSATPPSGGPPPNPKPVPLHRLTPSQQTAVFRDLVKEHGLFRGGKIFGDRMKGSVKKIFKKIKKILRKIKKIF